jgi:hypothetical protein
MLQGHKYLCSYFIQLSSTVIFVISLCPICSGFDFNVSLNHCLQQMYLYLATVWMQASIGSIAFVYSHSIIMQQPGTLGGTVGAVFSETSLLVPVSGDLCTSVT